MPNDRGIEYVHAPRGQGEPAQLRQLLAPFLTAADLPPPRRRPVPTSGTSEPRPSGEAGGVTPNGLLLELHHAGEGRLVPLLALLRLRTRAGPWHASIATLARQLGQDPRCVRRALSALEGRRLVTVRRPSGHPMEIEAMSWEPGKSYQQSTPPPARDQGATNTTGGGTTSIPAELSTSCQQSTDPGHRRRGVPLTSDERGSLTSRPRARRVWGIGVNHSGVDAPGASSSPHPVEAVRAATALMLDVAGMWPNTREEVQDHLSAILLRHGPEAMRAWVEQLLAALLRHGEARRGRLALGALRKRTASFRAASERAKKDTGGAGRGA